MEFSSDRYILLIKTLLEAGYHLGRFNQQEYRSPYLIIRHDVDLDLDAAARMAELEAEHNIFSTYFISMRSPFYNAYSEKNSTRIRKIHKLGHEVAVHINLVDVMAESFIDIKVMQQYYPFINSNIATIHHPGSFEKVKDLLSFPIIERTYGQIYEGNAAYLSDSTGKWRYGYPLESSAFAKKKSIVLLTHPIWWMEKGSTPMDKLMSALHKTKEDDSNISKFLPTFYKNNHYSE